MTPDFSKPHSNWHRYEVDGQAYYLPRGITRVKGLWRVTVKGRQEYRKTLEEAWSNLNGRQGGVPRIPEPSANGPEKQIETGLIGLHIAHYRKEDRVYVVIKVAQTLSGGRHLAVSAGQCNVDNLNQAWLDRALCVGAAMRARYLELRKQAELPDRVRARDVPDSLIPVMPIKAVSVQQVYDMVDRTEAP